MSVALDVGFEVSTEVLTTCVTHVDATDEVGVYAGLGVALAVTHEPLGFCLQMLHKSSFCLK